MLSINVLDFLNPKRTRPAIGFESTADLCPKCFSHIWHLWSRAGFVIHLDPEPLTFATDLEAYVAKRATYRLWRTGHFRFEADYRTARTVMAWDGSGVVLAAHICDRNNIRTGLPDYWPEQSPKTYEHQEKAPF